MIQAQLNVLWDQINRKIQLEDLTTQLRTELETATEQTKVLHSAMLAEQNDVDKLEAGGISTVLHKLTGRMEEKLVKERQEAQTACDEYHAAAARLAELERRLSESENELESLRDSQTQYIQLMLEQIRQLETELQDPENANREEELKLHLQLERRRKSLREALLESNEAYRAADQNLALLISVKNHTDIPLSAPEMESYLEETKVLAHFLQEEISDLQAKLAQMGIDPEPHISIGPYLKAPAVFLMGSLDEENTSIQLRKAIKEIEELQEQITKIEEKLTEALTQIETAITQF